MGIKECKVKKSSSQNLSAGIGISPEMFETEVGRCLGTHRCEGCGACIEFCPDSCISYVANSGIAINYDTCKGCGICAAICPKGAIEMVLEEVEE